MDRKDASAHMIAKHLRAIALMLPDLDAEQLDAFTINLKAPVVREFMNLLEIKAKRLEECSPFEPVADADKGVLGNWIAEQLADQSSREMFETHAGDWTEAEWRMEYDNYVELMDQ